MLGREVEDPFMKTYSIPSRLYESNPYPSDVVGCGRMARRDDGLDELWAFIIPMRSGQSDRKRKRLARTFVHDMPAMTSKP